MGLLSSAVPEISSLLGGSEAPLPEGLPDFGGNRPAPSIKEWYSALEDGEEMAIFDKMVWGLLGDGKLTGDYVKSLMGNDYLGYLKQLFSPQEGAMPRRHESIAHPPEGSALPTTRMPNAYRGPMVPDKGSLPPTIKADDPEWYRREI